MYGGSVDLNCFRNSYPVVDFERETLDGPEQRLKETNHLKEKPRKEVTPKVT